MSAYKFPDKNTEVSTQYKNSSALFNQLLNTRGLKSAEEIESFLNPDYDTQLHAPELMNDMSAACERVEAAMANGERIAIFSDYDCDGIPGAVVLHDFFKAIK